MSADVCVFAGCIMVWCSVASALPQAAARSLLTFATNITHLIMPLCRTNASHQVPQSSCTDS